MLSNAAERVSSRAPVGKCKVAYFASTSAPPPRARPAPRRRTPGPGHRSRASRRRPVCSVSPALPHRPRVHASARDGCGDGRPRRASRLTVVVGSAVAVRQRVGEAIVQRRLVPDSRRTQSQARASSAELTGGRARDEAGLLHHDLVRAGTGDPRPGGGFAERACSLSGQHSPGLGRAGALPHAAYGYKIALRSQCMGHMHS